MQLHRFFEIKFKISHIIAKRMKRDSQPQGENPSERIKLFFLKREKREALPRMFFPMRWKGKPRPRSVFVRPAAAAEK
jgi:hypothetical protein